MTWRLVSWGALAIVVFDALASVASRTLGFSYGYATVGSWLIYAVFGFMIGRRANVGAASLGVAIIAVVEATIGWAVSWAIGPGRPPKGTPSIGILATTVVLVAFTGAIIGALTGVLGRRWPTLA
ncbi:MAG TPA: hypothetical protein VGY54_17355 [Polyangiaceae bacterium]|nr:hypothetical protein [Polyangiaceae bacterium]